LANIINGTDTGSGGLITTGDSSDELQLQTAETTAVTITSGQQSAFIAGTAAAPAVTTTGDLNTGIYFPAADNIGFATGGTIRGRWTTDGLCFGSDTAAANALDDYEEGTWTATLTCGTSGTITLQVANQTGLYTKIGRTVNVSGYIVVNSVASPLGRLTLGGFPFSQIANGIPVGFPYLTTTNAYTGVAVLLGNTGVGATMDRNAGTGADPTTDFASAIKANTEIYFNLTYTTS
jgi:hypothetical protein